MIDFVHLFMGIQERVQDYYLFVL